MRPFFLLPLAFAGTLGVYGSVPRQEIELPSFRVIDLDKIVDQCQRFSGDKARFKKRVEERQKELESMRDELRELQRQIQEIVDPGDPKRFELGIRLDVRAREWELRKDQYDKQTEAERRKALVIYYEEIAEACAAYAKDEGLHAIFRSWRLDSEPDLASKFNLMLTRYHMYVDPTLDVSDEIVKRIDAQ